MTMYLENFASVQDLKPFVAERVRKYEDKAMAYLRHQFRPAVRLLSEADLRQVVQQAYKNARERGIRSERDHLKYLIPVMFWGSYFESDPQYRKTLFDAGWTDGDGNAVHGVAMPRLLDEIDRRVSMTAPDLAVYNRIMMRFREIYTQPVPVRPNYQVMLSIMEYIWPAHMRCGDQTQYRELISSGVSRGMELVLDTRDTIAYVCLSVYFGCEFDRSPVFPWAEAALRNDGRNVSERRAALWQGVSKYFESLSSVDEGE